MNGFEAAIRNALAKSDRTNPEIRARIYQSARHALEAGLRKQGVSDAGKIAAQRRWLEQLIATVEAGEQQAAAASRQPSGKRIEPDLSSHPAAAPVSGGRREPGLTVPPVERDEDDYDDDYADDDDLRAERSDAVPDGEMLGAAGYRQVALEDGVTAGENRAARPRRRRGFFARLFIYFILGVSLIMGATWLYISGALLSPQQRDTSVPNPPPSVADEDFAGTSSTPNFDPQGGFSGDWVEIFTPDAASRLRVGSAARAETTASAGGPAVRITSTRPGDEGQVQIDVPVDVLSRMAGRTSTVALTMQSATSESATVSVQCQFGSLGRCERHRFTANQEKFDALFRVTLPRGLTPGTPGALLVNPGLGGAGRSIDLFSVRVLPGE
ncbi:hypothetical protein NOF55_02005 [Rhizobiaceae bacterium BDR2-2]|uniref:Biotin transporter BioY n=1 Tax=Ectorhizobium quercum TaxID=2965071 RepID=A0AAE3STE6_9HYPH|nr:hypothetical protein [Ectorhizobium quercum]MCX8995872.1 hypothetical protein [Ectorhizobium quercum]